jgi:hypothetical protein
VTNCTQTSFEFPALKRRKVQAEFSGGEITSDRGVLLLRQIDRRLGLFKAVDDAIADPRDPCYIAHSQLSQSTTNNDQETTKTPTLKTLNMGGNLKIANPV